MVYLHPLNRFHIEPESCIQPFPSVLAYSEPLLVPPSEHHLPPTAHHTNWSYHPPQQRTQYGTPQSSSPHLYVSPPQPDYYHLPKRVMSPTESRRRTEREAAFNKLIKFFNPRVVFRTMDRNPDVTDVRKLKEIIINFGMLDFEQIIQWCKTKETFFPATRSNIPCESSVTVKHLSAKKVVKS